MTEQDKKKFAAIVKKYKLTAEEMWIDVQKGYRIINRLGISKIKHSVSIVVKLHLSYIGPEGVVVKAVGQSPDKSVPVETFGECNPKNNAFPYPVAIAQKRAESRAVLELVDIYGFVYGEDEIDEVAATDALIEKRKKGAEKSVQATLDLIKNKKG